MRQGTEYRYSRTSFILGDFITFNILYILFVYCKIVDVPTSVDGSMATYMVMANFAFACAQYFFANVVYQRHATFDRVVRQVTLLCLLYIVAVALFLYVISSNTLSHVPTIKFFVSFTLCLYVALLLARYVEQSALRRYRSMGQNNRHVVMVGSDASLLPLYEYFTNDPTMGYSVDGYYADEAIHGCPEALFHKGTLNDLENVMERPLSNGLAHEVYCSLPTSKKLVVSKLMKYCDNNAIHFYYVPSVESAMGRSFSVKRIGDNIVFTRYIEPLASPTNKFVKRAFDIAFSGITLLCMLPFIPLLAFIIKKQSPGPIFFKQLRTGLDGRSFYCYKFRSMHINKDADTVQATEDDPRKFAFGNFMRKTNIDELPQFWNVFKGDMSIVGPRPHMLHHTDIYSELIDKYMIRHFVKPGITGWAQVTGFRGETKELWQMEGRVKRDIWYIENWSIWLDLRIIWKTAKSVFVHDQNAY